MATKSKTKEEVRQEQVETSVSKFEQFYEKYKNIIWAVLGAIVVIWLAILGYQKYIYQPKCAEAQEQAFPAEASFAQGEYELALNGDGNVLGFTEIIDSYGSKAGKAVYLYAGICELQLG
ncbi:MAG: tetratricopeptide repeat protein, partial [Bacteroidales bacterium]|nr:tetratricopeptide repeat protein [Bacteroidales bacterium]